MAEQLIAEGNALNLYRVTDYEDRYAEGDKGELLLYLRTDVGEDVCSALQGAITSAGVTLWRPVQCVARVLHVPFQKTQGPLAMILAILGAFILIAILALLIGWQLTKIVTMGVAGIPLWVWLLGGGFLGYVIFRGRK